MRVTNPPAFAPGARGHEIGHAAPRALVRRAAALEGEVAVRMERLPAEELDPTTTTTPLAGVPQAITHVGLVNAARSLTDAEGASAAA